MNKAFRENGIEYDRVNYFIEPLTEDKLRDLLKKANLEPADVLRTREKIGKELGLNKESPPDELIKHMIKHPGLLERPIVEVGNRAVLARPIDKAIELIGA